MEVCLYSLSLFKENSLFKGSQVYMYFLLKESRGIISSSCLKIASHFKENSCMRLPSLFKESSGTALGYLFEETSLSAKRIEVYP